MGGFITVIQSDSTINTLILEASGEYALYDLANYISMAREMQWSSKYIGEEFEVESMWSHGIIHKKHCVLLKGSNNILKMLVTCAKDSKIIKAWYTAICPNQEWSKSQEKWVKTKEY